MLIQTLPDLRNAFSPEAKSVLDFFSNNDPAYYIPLYQREYSWNADNIEQLMEDLTNGVWGLLSDENSVRFLGTVILCQENRVNILPQDPQAMPGLIFNVIDGQQRISTIGLLATRIYKILFKLNSSMKKDLFFQDLTLYLDDQLTELSSLYSLDFGGGAIPRMKPIIIRGGEDTWTQKGEDSKYVSKISHYLAGFIRNSDKGGIGIPDRRTRLGMNLKLIDQWLEKIFSSHLSIDPSFPYPPAQTIFKTIAQELIWRNPRPDYFDYIHSNDDKKSSQLSSCVQLLAFIQYLFRRSCFSVIYPTSENWAFDMFQSLNATGTPLTAIETFKPYVVNSLKSNGGYGGSKSEEYFTSVDSLFSKISSASGKSKLTNEYLNTFRLVYEGQSQSNQFSDQRKWLNKTYGDQCNSISKKEEFVHRMSDLALYYRNVLWFDHTLMKSFHGLDSVPEKDRLLAVLCVKYISESSHRMAHTILSRFYSMVLRNVPGYGAEFVKACRIIAAFYSLWRSALPNTGLDEVYRRILNENSSNSGPCFSWAGNQKDLTVKSLKKHFKLALKSKDIGNKNDWLNKAKVTLSYDSAKSVCKFALFCSAHDTGVDPQNPGLMKSHRAGYSDYLNINSWVSSDLKTIEHIAPRTKSSSWDDNIYRDNLQESIGNLTLLPLEINSSANNKGWKEKFYYYKHLAVSDKATLLSLAGEAKHDGIDLADQTIELLCAARYADHIRPIVKVSKASSWNKNIIEARTERICSIFYDKLESWLK